MSELPRYVIGLTGLPSSGKGEAAKALLSLLPDRGWRGEQILFSDQIKEEAQRRGIPDERFTRELLSQIGIEMREKEGPGVLAARIARKIESWPAPRPELFIADGVRHVGEVEVLRKAFGSRFVLASVESEPREIARRLLARRRADESPEAMQSEEKAIRLLKQELNGELSELGPNVGECMKLADVRLPNHGTLEDLRRTVETFFNSLTKKR